jgi:ferredoxin
MLRKETATSEEFGMKVNVDKSLCVLTGNCAMAAERVFRIEGTELEYKPSPGEPDHAAVREAVEDCPVQAISLEE